MTPHPTLKGLARWITAPSVISGVLGAALAVAYGLRTLELAPGTGVWFSALGLLASVVGTAIGDRFEQRSLATLRQLGAGTLPADVPNLRKAFAEAAHLPDVSFRVSLIIWAIGTALVGLSYRLFPGVTDWGVSLRVALLFAGFAPLVSVITYLLVLPRSRNAMTRLAEAGLTPTDAVVALPPRRNQLRWRLMFLIAVSSLTPSILIADAVNVRTSRALEVIIAAGPNVDVERLGATLTTGRDVGGDLLGLSLVLIAILTAVAAGAALVRPLTEIATVANRFAQGDVSEGKVIAAEDEVWAASAAFAMMQAQLSEALARLRGAGLRISSTTEQLLAATSAQHEGSTEQSVSLNETTATTEELARSARQIAENGAAVAEIAEKTLRAAQAGQSSSQNFFAAMLRMREDNQKVADSVLKLNKRVQQIGKIVEFIHEVGDKSDLLALNAELEGTKAGEVGRGFSLVAAEMRRLAENVIRSTHEIEKLIEDVRDGTNAAVMATESGLKAMDSGTQLATTVLDGLSAILEQARQTSDAVRSISLSTQQQQTGTDQLAEAMAEILRITEDGRGAGDQMARANQVLSGLAGSLKEVVGQFRVDGPERGAGPGVAQLEGALPEVRS